MFRRSLLAVEGMALALGLGAGCGPIYRSTLKVESVLARAEAGLVPNRLDYTVYQPSHRVALATHEVLKAELAEVSLRDVELTQDRHFDTPEGKTPKPGEAKIPDDYPAFWMEGLNSDGPLIVNCRLVEFAGKTRDGKRVDASVRLEIMGSDRRTVVSVRVGRTGDDKPTKDLIDKIALKIQQPSTRPGSTEERDALKAAFDPGPKGNLDFSRATGEIRIRKN